jgi:hypothetical protein
VIGGLFGYGSIGGFTINSVPARSALLLWRARVSVLLEMENAITGDFSMMRQLSCFDICSRQHASTR